MNENKRASGPNKPDPANLAMTLRLAIGEQWRRVADPGRSAIVRFITVLLLGSSLLVGLQRSVRLPDVAAVRAVEREKARSNWEHVRKAFQANDPQALNDHLGCQVLINFDADESPWVGRAFAADLREPSAREGAWNVPCKIDFTRKQVRGHFMWPDPVFGADFELLGTLTSASISDDRVRIKPIAIQSIIFQL